MQRIPLAWSASFDTNGRYLFYSSTLLYVSHDSKRTHRWMGWCFEGWSFLLWDSAIGVRRGRFSLERLDLFRIRDVSAYNNMYMASTYDSSLSYGRAPTNIFPQTY